MSTRNIRYSVLAAVGLAAGIFVTFGVVTPAESARAAVLNSTTCPGIQGRWYKDTSTCLIYASNSLVEQSLSIPVGTTLDVTVATMIVNNPAVVENAGTI
jgi:hypothetical protein